MQNFAVYKMWVEICDLGLFVKNVIKWLNITKVHAKAAQWKAFFMKTSPACYFFMKVYNNNNKVTQNF